MKAEDLQNAVQLVHERQNQAAMLTLVNYAVFH